MPRRVAMAGPRCHHQRHGCRGVAYDVAVTSRAEIIRNAVRMVGSLRRLASNHPSRSWGPALLSPCTILIRKPRFVAQCRREPGVREDFS